MLCPLCKERTGYKELYGGQCARCTRDNNLFNIGDIRDKIELMYHRLESLLYRIEVFEGLRPPPASDRPDPHGVQRESATGASSPSRERRFSPLMKQGSGRSQLSEDDLT